MANAVRMGDFAKDVISGFDGVVDSIHYYLNGCVRVGISPTKVASDGKPIPTNIFDVNQVVATGGSIRDQMPGMEENVSEVQVAGTPGPGGPYDDPPRHELPSR